MQSRPSVAGMPHSLWFALDNGLTAYHQQSKPQYHFQKLSDRLPWEVLVGASLRGREMITATHHLPPISAALVA